MLAMRPVVVSAPFGVLQRWHRALAALGAMSRLTERCNFSKCHRCSQIAASKQSPAEQVLVPGALRDERPRRSFLHERVSTGRNSATATCKGRAPVLCSSQTKRKQHCRAVKVWNDLQRKSTLSQQPPFLSFPCLLAFPPPTPAFFSLSMWLGISGVMGVLC